jgi:hypothetical protein
MHPLDARKSAMALSKKQLRTIYIVVCLIIATYVVPQFDNASRVGGSRNTSAIEAAEVRGQERVEGPVERAFRNEQSNTWRTVTGEVSRLLSDDDQGSRHQRLILELASGHTVLIAHNIDLANRINNIAVGDSVRVKGEYEWNLQGGVIHWTHKDPQGRRDGGWIEHQSRRYE